MSPASPFDPFAATGAHRVCVPVSGTSPADLLTRAGHLLAEHPFLELRLDSAAIERHAPAHLRDAIRHLLVAHPSARLIATCRRIVAGGNFAGGVAEELAVLFAAVEGGCSIADLAVESAEELGADRLEDVRATLHARGAALLISYHNFEKTPDLEQVFARLAHHRPDIFKIVTTAATLTDNLVSFSLLRSRPEAAMLAICMGEQGLLSRVLGPRAGALFTFAAASFGAETAPGQIDAATLRNLYRIEELGAATRLYGVAGEPIQHSLSPLVHNAAFQARGIDAVFLPLPTRSAAELSQVVHALPLAGISVTMPLKQTVLHGLDELDPLAARVGACNTIVRTHDGMLRGFNTDVAGVIAPLEERIHLRGARVLVRGAGGAARAAVFALCDAGANVSILNRTRATAERLAAEAGAQVADHASLEPQSFDVLVNAVPAGMHGMMDVATPGEQSEETLLLVSCAKLVFDMVYNPLDTPLLQHARASGLPVIAGLEMFVHQAARQFELWTGQTAPREEMARVAEAKLREAQYAGMEQFHSRAAV